MNNHQKIISKIIQNCHNHLSNDSGHEQREMNQHVHVCTTSKRPIKVWNAWRPRRSNFSLIIGYFLLLPYTILTSYYIYMHLALRAMCVCRCLQVHFRYHATFTHCKHVPIITKPDFLWWIKFSVCCKPPSVWAHGSSVRGHLISHFCCSKLCSDPPSIPNSTPLSFPNSAPPPSQNSAPLSLPVLPQKWNSLGMNIQGVRAT